MSDVTAPMAGKVIDVKVNVGDTVNEDDDLIILEAMKMEMPIVAPASGTVKEIKCNKGDSVGADDVLAVIE
ncbi:MAG TPA: acetyl-CoA carboxylase biotin carboxyl carrier protein subunit [Desulfobacteraceae bacterium]|nr:acetyl-CoA carboxylase biotin carboxyl carrier protein subunit [Deltaproteobacteria bacterium]MCD6265087.1 acetyl-CoA carboxylase biotin carboxyl carrier protein subunit [Deltaproteobacteria bacterium]RLB25045.1 MAG: acetyl-CoA carboxylase biotin carboxyl carrier protein subunit [Deltaproteobacteria bacterium]HDH87089.1 acetyl-CoA carboxylase biotin carboxyl carrier protein subunit [Desulfobacteraceae bacterium]